MIEKISFIIILLTSVVQVLGTKEDRRHPVYIIAHMANSIHEVDDYLRRGANAIEADVTFTSKGEVDSIYHGYPCDCFRVCSRKEKFSKYISYIRNITTPGTKNYKENFTLLFLDLKVKNLIPQLKYPAGIKLTKALVKYLWNGGDNVTVINVLLSVGTTEDSQVIRAVKRTLERDNLTYLLPRIGFDVGMNDHPLKISNMWKSLGMELNKWQGDGISNCLFPMRPTRRLDWLLRKQRDGESYMSKIYQWTVDFSVHFRRYLGSGVEAFITNYPERLSSLLQESKIRQFYRLATINDNIWERVPIYPSVVRAEVTDTPISSNVYTIGQEVMDSLSTFFTDAFSNTINRGVINSEYLSLMNYFADTNNDRSEPEQPDPQSFCQYSLCLFYQLYSNQTASRRLQFVTDCMQGRESPFMEISTICRSLDKLVHNLFVSNVTSVA